MFNSFLVFINMADGLRVRLAMTDWAVNCYILIIKGLMSQTGANNRETGLNIRSKVIWMTRTAVFIALLTVLQVISSMAGNQLITGTVVNTILVVCVMTAGLSSGITLAATSPVLAALLGIGPHLALTPFIALGNMVFVLLWRLIGYRLGKKRLPGLVVAVVVAGTAKFAVLFLSIVKIAVPFLLSMDESRTAVISAMFSVPQLINAVLGGSIALIIIIGYGRIIEGIK